MHSRCRKTRARSSRLSCSRTATCSRASRRRNARPGCTALGIRISCARTSACRTPGDPDLQQRAFRLLGRAGRESLGHGVPLVRAPGRARGRGAGRSGPGGERPGHGDVPGRQQLRRAPARALADPGVLPGHGGRRGSAQHRDRAARLRRLDRPASPGAACGSTRRPCTSPTRPTASPSYFVRGGQLQRVRGEAVRARLLQRDHSPPRAGAAVGTEGRPRARREDGRCWWSTRSCRDGQALEKLGIKGAQLPGSFLQNLFLVTGINVGDYRVAWRPEDPCVMQSFASFNGPMPAGASLAAQMRAARAQMLAMPFEDYEREVRSVLDEPARPGRLRRRARHPRHHRESLAARLCARSPRPRGRRLERRAGPRSGRPAAVRQRRDRELRRGGGRLHARGDRPGLAGGNELQHAGWVVE